LSEEQLNHHITMTTHQENAIQALSSQRKTNSHAINIRCYSGDSLELQIVAGGHIDGPRQLHFCKPHETLEEVADVVAYCLHSGIPYFVEGSAARDFVRSHLMPTSTVA
jgi:hypothetical protein